MGALHAGHLSLVELAADEADSTVVSIFINPAQFGQGEDFEEYPRNMERDIELLSEYRVDALFEPEVADIYPGEYSTWVDETGISDILEGISRPGHFRGVATVVTKLLLIVEPDMLVLGQKDAQQVAVLKKVISDLGFAVEVVVGPTIRESDGLALSSRNSYLSNEERVQAVCLFDALNEARRLVDSGEKVPEVVLTAMRDRIEKNPSARIDYIAAVDPRTLKPMESLRGEVLFDLAVFIGDTRLIDNELIGREE